MAYATLSDATDLYGEDYVLVAADKNDDGTPDTSVVTDALDNASSLMDSYIGVRYGVPLSSVPSIVVNYCIDIAVYMMSPGMTRTKEKRQRYEDAMSWLKAIARGDAGLGIADDDPVNENLPSVSAGTRQHTRTKLSGLI